MKTLTLSVEHAQAVKDAVRSALVLAHDAVEDAEVFPDQFSEEEIAAAQAKVALLQEVLDKLIAN